MARVVTVVVNYCTADLVLNCLRTLAVEGPGPVYVVDNASPDGSRERLQSDVARLGWANWCRVVAAPGNHGYAAGNNVGLSAATADGLRPDYVWFLNPDTEVRPGAGSQLAAFLDSRPRVGIAGSRLENPDGSVQRSAFRFPGILGELEGGLRLGITNRLLARYVIAPAPRPDAHQSDWVSGASMMVRRAVIDQIGPMDEGFFLYFEEVDYCRKARAAGWDCWYVPASRVVHLVGQSTGFNDGTAARKPMPPYWFSARQRYYRNHHGWLYGKLADAAWACGHAVWRLRRRVLGKPDNDPPGLLGDFIRASFGQAPRSAM